MSRKGLTRTRVSRSPASSSDRDGHIRMVQNVLLSEAYEISFATETTTEVRGKDKGGCTSRRAKKGKQYVYYALGNTAEKGS